MKTDDKTDKIKNYYLFLCVRLWSFIFHLPVHAQNLLVYIFLIQELEFFFVIFLRIVESHHA